MDNRIDPLYGYQPRMFAQTSQSQPTGAGLSFEQIDRVLRSGSYNSPPGVSRNTWMFGQPRGLATSQRWNENMDREEEANRTAGMASRFINPATGQPLGQIDTRRPATGIDIPPAIQALIETIIRNLRD